MIKHTSPMEQEQYIAQTKRWLETFVLGFDLCPFAHTPYKKNQIRFVVSNARNREDLLRELEAELELLQNTPAGEVETTLLIIPHFLEHFLDYLDALDDGEDLLLARNWEGVFQVASFHPNYQFEGTHADDAENYTNRSPYPMFHLLREERIEQALQFFPNPEDIPETNIQRMRNLGMMRLKLSLDDIKRSN